MRICKNLIFTKLDFISHRTIQSSSEGEIKVTYSGSVGYLEHVVVQLSSIFEDVDLESYLNNDVYYNLYPDIYYYYYYVEPNRGDIQFELTSPSGTVSILLPYRTRDSWPGYFYEWPFMSVHFWGEDPSGDWTLKIRNRGTSSFPLIVSDVTFTFYGTTKTPEVVARIPVSCDSACARGCAAPGPLFCDSCRNLRDAASLECVDECAEGLTELSGYCYNATEPEPVCEPPTSSPTTDGSPAPTTDGSPGVNPVLLLLLALTLATCLATF